MQGERFYVAMDDDGKTLVIGWNLNHEPTLDNECGYVVASGPYRTKKEAEENL